MADTAGSFVYAKGFLVGSDNDWFHGELSTVQANHALSASHTDCFLVRVDQGALVLSLSHHGQLHHININYGPGWYELESGSAQYSFTELEELVAHYSETAISDDLKFTLGEVCRQKTAHEYSILEGDYQDILPYYEAISDDLHNYETIPEATPHHYDYISSSHIYSKGEPEDLAKYKWYHGKKTRDQADAMLSLGTSNRFLVRHHHDELILSRRFKGHVSHVIIQRSPKGYRLDGSKKLFCTIPAMIAHHHKSFGVPVETPTTDLQLKSSAFKGSIFPRETDALQVSWKRCADLPVAFSAPHVVKIGEDVYVGGGIVADKTGMADCVFKYSYSEDIWGKLPSCKTLNHSLTTLHDELIAIGGTRFGLATNAVRTFRDGEWKKVLPPMLTPRWSLATASHDNNIIVAAGGVTMLRSNGEGVQTNTIEIYTTDKQVWYTATKFPFPLVQFQTCIVSDACYTLGGTPSTIDEASKALSATMSSFLENADNATPWKQLQDHPLIYSTPVELAGRLVAVGGSAELRLRCGTRIISTYDFATDTWVECKGAALPAPLYRPGVLKLDDSRVMIVGGQPKMQQFSAAVYIGNYKMK